MNPSMEIFREFRFEAAHRLPLVPPGHKCARLHGHSFRVMVCVTGDIDAKTGMVCDYAEIRRAFEPLLDQLDHHYLNQIKGLENPTSETLAVWIVQRLKPALPGLSRVRVHETCNCGCELKL